MRARWRCGLGLGFGEGQGHGGAFDGGDALRREPGAGHDFGSSFGCDARRGFRFHRLGLGLAAADFVGDRANCAACEDADFGG